MTRGYGRGLDIFSAARFEEKGAINDDDDDDDDDDNDDDDDDDDKSNDYNIVGRTVEANAQTLKACYEQCCECQYQVSRAQARLARNKVTGTDTETETEKPRQRSEVGTNTALQGQN